MNKDAVLNTSESTAAFSDHIAELSLHDLAPNTFAQYKQQLRSFQNWLADRPLSANAAKQFLAEMRDKGYSQKSIKLYYVPIRAFLEYLGMPFKVKFRRQRHLPAYHSSGDVERLIEAADNRADKWAKVKTRDRLIILMLAFTGLRRAELPALTPSDIVNNYIFVRSGKGDKDRIIPLSPVLREPLANYIEENSISPSSPIFPVAPKRIYTIVRNYASAAGVDMTPHGLRHYFATALIERGAPLPAIQQLLGHATIATTAVYLDMVPHHLQSSIALLDGSISVNNISTIKRRSGSGSLSLSLSSKSPKSTPVGKENLRCGLSLNKGRPLTQPLISAPSRASPSIGQGPGASFASARDAPTALPGSPNDGDTRPRLLSTARASSGSSENRVWQT